MNKAWIRWAGLALAALPAIVPLALIRIYGVNFHFWDEWDPGIAGFLVRFHDHSWTLSELFAQHNEHRIAIPRLIFALLGEWAHWNNFATLLTAWAIVFATSLMLLALSRRTRMGSRECVLWFLCNLLIFTPTAYENWLWGIGLANVVVGFFIVASFWIARSSLPESARWILCLLLASAATYSSGNGCLAWPLTGALLWHASTKNRKRWAIAWIAAAALNGGLYFIGYKSASMVDAQQRTTSLRLLIPYNLAFLGNIFAFINQQYATVIAEALGGLMLALLIACAAWFFIAMKNGRRDVCGRMLVWFAVAGYGIFSGVISSFNRAGSGVQMAYTPRYGIFGAFVPLAVVQLIPIVCDDVWKNRTTRMTLTIQWLATAGLVALCLFTWPAALDLSSQMRLVRRESKAALLLADVLPQTQYLSENVYFDPGKLIEEANALNRIGYLQPPLIGTSNAQLIRTPQTGDVTGSMDNVSRSSPTALTLIGWAYCTKADRLADAVFVTYRDAHDDPIIFAAADLLVHREDIATKNGDAKYRWSGWGVVLSLDRLPTNLKSTKIEAWVLDADTALATQLPGVVSFGR